MGDNWDDDDFDASLPVAPVSTKVPASWEEEDEALNQPEIIAPGPTLAQIEAARQKAQLEEDRLQNTLKYAETEALTEEEKKIKARKQVEEDDAKIAAELFEGPGSVKVSNKAKTSGLGGIVLKNREDHANFGILISTKMAESTSFCVTACLKEVLQRNKDNLSAENLDELLALLQGYKDTKIVAKDISKNKNTVVNKEKKAAKKKHEDIFGGKYDAVDKYDNYASIEDDFM